MGVRRTEGENGVEYTLDEAGSGEAFDGIEENRRIALALAQQARQEILIASYDLDTHLYSNNEFIDALAGLVRGHRSAHVHVLTWQAKQVARHGHRLIELAQRLSSTIQIHEPDRVHGDFIESFMVVDGTGYFHRSFADRFEGTSSLHAPLAARQLRERFIAMWERSTPSSEFRRLGI